VRKVKLDIDNRTIIRVMAVVVAFWLGLSIAYQIRGALTLLIISFFLALALNPSVSFLASKIPGGSRGLATGLAYIIVLGILGLFVYSTFPPLISETRNLVQTVPDRIENLEAESQDGFLSDIITRYGLEQEAEELADSVTQRLGDIGGPIVTGIGAVTASIIAFVTVLILTFLMLVEGPQWMALFWSYYPKEKRKHHQELARKMYHVVTGYVNGQLLVASIAGLSSLVMLVIVGVPNAIALAGLVALTGLIPLIGATLGAVIVVLFTLFQSLTQALIMLAFFIVYQQIENNAIQPYVQSRALEISPLLVLVAVIVGIQLGGLLAGFLAIPVAACLRILALDFAKNYKNA
jgi:predicted PurR-regulated permease PerM